MASMGRHRFFALCLRMPLLQSRRTLLRGMHYALARSVALVS